MGRNAVDSRIACSDSIDDQSIPCYPKFSHPERRSRRLVRPKGWVGHPRAGLPRGMGDAGWRVDLFLSNPTSRRDPKGRVSIPAPYRAVRGRDGCDGLYCYPALGLACIYAGGNALISDIQQVISRYSPYSEPRDAFALALY